ncbi:DinB family protein [Arthrobacter sp. MMS18-M83]|uniref:DinB family protein n=1 Tax=Arthrobacter sp. MMS18-M83 TaxID=2996261 RepID=UPI00227C29BD|nr:DinB family protein [Arthrobacter sp. MMS18-M83]WAH95934.1 DinB family protein [Arthrobacter sp. MMS18-M83]
MDPGREATVAGYRRARRELASWLETATAADLQRKSNGTRWTNEELLFHMVFGYMIIRALLPLVRFISRLPRSWSRGFAAALNAATGPFDVVNYWGSVAAATVYNRHRMGRKLEKTITALARRLERETPESLARSAPFPTRWDPFFTADMTLTDTYAYATQHFDFHAKQLSLRSPHPS